MSKKIRAWFANGLIFLLVSMVIYAFAEWSFLRVFTRILPMSMVTKFEEPDGIWPLLQSSKRGFYPKDYIALAGDSYAMGMGDAMYEAIPDDRRPRFHSAHTIQDLTGRDVVAFGQPGSGSIRGAISNPEGSLYYLRKMVGDDFPSPKTMLVYFYEGNDLTENWMYYEKTFLPDHPASDYENPQVFDSYIRDVAFGRQHLCLAADAASWKNHLFFAQYVKRIFSEKILGKKFYRKKYPGEFGMMYVPESRWVPRKVPQPVNHALINGQVVALPDNLQGPSMDLSQQQLLQAAGTFDKALAWSRRYFPDTQFAVVYIPSVLSVYQLVGDEVEEQNYFSDSDTRFKVADLERRHAWIQQEIARICHAQGVKFVDVTSDLREVAARQVLHGPHDWNHFNRRGYEVLGESVVKQMPELH